MDLNKNEYSFFKFHNEEYWNVKDLNPCPICRTRKQLDMFRSEAKDNDSGVLEFYVTCCNCDEGMNVALRRKVCSFAEMINAWNHHTKKESK